MPIARVLPEGDAGLRDAHVTLCRGSAFLMRTFADGAGRYRAKLLGNALRELDVFLNHLVIEAGRRRGATSPRFERNTANALARLRWRLGVAASDTRRLRALGRSRACLFYCDGVVRRADLRGGTRMTLGWGGAATVPLGTRLTVDAGVIADICAFYDRVGDDVLRIALDRPRKPEGPPFLVGTAAPVARPRVASL